VSCLVRVNHDPDTVPVRDVVVTQNVFWKVGCATMLFVVDMPSPEIPYPHACQGASSSPHSHVAALIGIREDIAT
jgi:hypothetical protein